MTMTMTDRLALTVDETATLLGCSPRHVWGMAAAGKLPRPVSIGRSKRWLRADIESWLADESRRANEGVTV